MSAEPTSDSTQDSIAAQDPVRQLDSVIQTLGALQRTLRAVPPVAPRAASAAEVFRWSPGERERISLLPIVHQDIWEVRKTLEGLHWTAQEVNYTKDLSDWTQRMSPSERGFVKFQLAFFARIDVDVLSNLDENFGEEIDCLEARMVYAAQKNQECVHAESYGLQIEAVMSGVERDLVLNAVRRMPIIAKMRRWVVHWFDRKKGTVGDRLVAFTFIEGVLFSGSFCALQWLKQRNLLPGISESNDFISRDEGVHTMFGCLLVRKYLIARPSQERVVQILEEMMQIIDEFTTEALPVRLLGMNAEQMCQYVRFQADCVLADMGYQHHYRAANPFPFMDAMALNVVAKSNFFEIKVTQYQSVTVEGHTDLSLDGTPVDEF